MNPDYTAEDIMSWIDSPFDTLTEYINNNRRNQTINQGTTVHNMYTQALNAGRLNNTLREMAREFLPQAMSEDLEEMIKTPEKKGFTTFQVVEKLDNFIAEIKANIPGVDKVVIGGSLGLLFQGYDLGRPIGDLDILIECSDLEKTSLAIRSYLAKYPFLKSSDGSDFQLAIGYGNTYERIKVDISFKRNVNAVVTTYNGKTYLANDYKDIISYKINYCQSNPKHFHDIIKLIDKQPIKKVKFTTNV